MMGLFSNGARIMALIFLCGSLAQARQQAGQEILYPGEAFAKLDTFEGVNLEDADKLFVKKDYKGAYAAYKAYSFEFAKSKALPYVQLRLGRCLHLLAKRNEAIKAYQDVVDYFPDEVVYAAAALYYIGECHGQNGDEEKKAATWAKMVKDDAYVSQPNSGAALTYLGKRMEELGRFEEAIDYHRRTAVAFLQSNPDAARAAREAVIYHYVVRSPNHEKLKAFYTAASGFEGRGGDVATPQEDPRYWHTVMSTALNAQCKPEQKITACAYWSEKMGDRFVDNDGLRKQWFNVLLQHEQDRAKWMARADKQFAQKPSDMNRILQWCDYYRNDSKKRADFFSKQGAPLVAAMKFAEKLSLMERLRQLGMHEESQAVIRSVSFQGLSDEEIRSLALFAAHYLNEDQVLGMLKRIQEPLFAAKSRFDYYVARTWQNRPFQEKALAEVAVLKKDPKYAGQSMTWSEAELLRMLGRHEEAIKAYQAANRQPDSTWAVTDCLVALQQYGAAIKNVQGLESVGGAVAAQACLKVADILRASNDKAKEIEQLRLVLRRYPKSGESSTAHQRLEAYGVKVTGGEAKADS
jgi:tetratricopeptide (TPR) repeat protein